MSAALKVSEGETEPVEMGRRLGVNAIMSGTFEQKDDRFEVTVTLIGIPGGAVLSKRTSSRSSN